ncbi:uncharacterized protein B0I36DRAFT_407814 [Microdochium trichocladiopsis]|uniref:Actin-like ATPase domain-containing protein n=1 Tax=Microdochium trichocladiopsis TaxID=1682393 RepID=A0A9P9BPI3_9PEZI|nr:uncharacterized protein B0I36DRAFT_407814 [Microdochium trichocladiopsis]KAH7033159.1 hypothetical protein B0I36DRAFT_407814 [Microdochium trichocladiopsis]
MALVVCFDFGTTSSGIAYLEHVDNANILSEARNVTVIEHLLGSRHVPKVPSKIAYGPNKTIKWGFDAETELGVISLLKLLPLEEEDIRDCLLNFDEYILSKKQMDKLNKDAIEVVSDYLRLLWAKFLADCERHSPFGDELEKNSLRIVFTVPAIWPEYYRVRLLEAARRAGILNTRPGLAKTTLEFVTEPEAAVYKLLHDSSIRNGLNIGDTMLTCDCGGGTIDVITYGCTSTTPLLVKEVIPGDGALYGGIILDQSFSEALKTKLTALHGFSRPRMEQDRAGFRDTMIFGWEHGLKPSFDGSRSGTFRPFWLNAPPLSFSIDELEDIYDPVVAGILDVVNRQLDCLRARGLPKPRFIMLAGGFGLSLYVRNKLRQEFADSQGIHIFQEESDLSWSTVARGGALFGLSSQSLVRSRVLRDGFALVHSPEWEEDIHDERDFIVDPVRKTGLARDQLLWFFKKGEDVDVGGFREYKLNFVWSRADRGIKRFEQPLYTSSAAVPPHRLKDAKKVDVTFAEHAKMAFETPVPVQRLPLERGQRKLNYSLRIEAVSGRAVTLTAVWDENDQVIGRTRMNIKDT